MEQVIEFGNNKEVVFRDHIKQGKSPLVALNGLADLLQSVQAFNDSHAAPSNQKYAFRCLVVTNACRANAEFMLSHIGVAPLFQDLVIGDECSAGKPDPAPYLEAMRRANVKPEECIVFEDSASGIKSAVAAGIKTIVGITTTQSPEALKSIGAAYAAPNFEGMTLQSLDQLNIATNSIRP
eukprot:TRINITY_DN5033_c0_g1_i2.p1 TRINITY_DN5033_c0_g1~~TRINITY_DN5033_c0_g1_i2.p1  ORF type:complete len:181 (-),score=47.61 TRINITY_DN5033_c0_g1_i2:28-570(-)